MTSFVPFFQSMKKGTEKNLWRAERVPPAASLERRPAGMVVVCALPPAILGQRPAGMVVVGLPAASLV